MQALWDSRSRGSGAWSYADQIRDQLIRDSGTWNHVNQIQYREIKKRCGETATVLYCLVVLTKDYK